MRWDMEFESWKMEVGRWKLIVRRWFDGRHFITFHLPPSSFQLSGQGLLEMIVAIGIVTTGLFSAMTLVSGTLAASTEGSRRFVAANLAREGVEVIRSLRDSNWLRGAPWNNNLIGPGTDRTARPIFDPATGLWTLDFSISDVADEAARIYQGIAAGAPSEGLFLNIVGAPGPELRRTDYQRLIGLFPICRDDAGNEVIVEEENADCRPGSREVGLDVRSTVVWLTKGQPHTLIAEEKLYDWR